MTITNPAIMYERIVRASDVTAVRSIVQATGFFNDEEVAIAVELAEDAAANGADSDYQFILAQTIDESPGQMKRVSTIGFAAFGRIDGTRSSWDLYWVAVHPDVQARGLGRTLMQQAEQRIAAQGGTRVYVETSSRPQYEPTRVFYERCGYRVEALLADFYAPGDGKLILIKQLSPA